MLVVVVFYAFFLLFLFFFLFFRFFSTCSFLSPSASESKTFSLEWRPRVVVEFRTIRSIQ